MGAQNRRRARFCVGRSTESIWLLGRSESQESGKPVNRDSGSPACPVWESAARIERCSIRRDCLP